MEYRLKLAVILLGLGALFRGHMPDKQDKMHDEDVSRLSNVEMGYR